MKRPRVVRGISVEEGSGNVYADLGYADSESMLVKARLAAKIAEIVKRRALTQTRAAEILGLTQPKVSDPVAAAEPVERAADTLRSVGHHGSRRESW